MNATPKFTINQRVKFFKNSDAEAGVVLSYSYDGEKFTYRISSREVDIAAKKIIEGVKVCLESELVAVGEVTNEN